MPNCIQGFSFGMWNIIISFSRIALIISSTLFIVLPSVYSQCGSLNPWRGSYGIWSGPGSGGGDLPPSDVMTGGVIKVPSSLLITNDPSLYLFRTSFHYRDTVCITNNFSFETRIKNPNSEGGVDAYDTRIEILGSGLNAGCNLMGAAWAQQYNSAWVGGTTIQNQPGLVVNLNDWSTIKMEFNNGTLHYSRDGVEFFQLPYTGNICNIYGFNFTFKGSGSIDWVRLTDAYGNTVYFEDFLDCNNFSRFPACETPTLSLGYTPPTCSNNQLELDVSTTSTQPLQYTWTGPDGFTSTLQNPVINNPTSAAIGTYQVQAMSNYCNPPVTQNIVVSFPNSYQNLPTRNISICQGASYTLPGGGVVNTAGAYIDTIANGTVINCFDIITTNLTVNTPVIDAGGDQIICLGTNAQLNATGGFIYTWDSAPSLSVINIANPVATPAQTTTYIVRSQVQVGNNLVINGDFELGNTGFSSGYTYSGTSGFDRGDYGIGQNPNLYNNGFSNCGDHTSGTGNMLIADAACGDNGVPSQTNFWCQQVSVTPNSEYAFSAWLTNLVPGNNASRLLFSINGSPIGTPINTPPTGCQWNQFYVTWNSGTNTTANLCIAEGSNNVCSGNDFAVDDISFYQLCEAVDSVRVIVSDLQVQITDSIQVDCNGNNTGSATVTPISGTAPFTYVWSNGQTDSIALNLIAGTYSVTVTDSVNCQATASVTITQPPAITNSVSVDICGGETYTLGGNNFSSSGVYPTTLTSINGCDSLVVLTLYVAPPDGNPLPASTFNTGTNGNGGTITNGAPDALWQVSPNNINGPYSPTVAMSPIPGSYYNSPWADCRWISHQMDGRHTGNIIYYYKAEFELPCFNHCGQSYALNDVFCLSLDFFADNSVTEIYVNGIPQSANINGMPVSAPYTHTGFQGANMVTASFCSGWQGGMNTLIIEVSSGSPYAGFLAQASVHGSPQPQADTVNAEICYGGSYSFGGTLYDTAGYYSHTFYTTAGCDSLVVLDLSVKPTPEENVSVNICGGQSYILPGGNSVSLSGLYTDTLTSSLGCDSIIHTNLVVNNVHIDATSNAPVICLGSSAQLNATGGFLYTWDSHPSLSATNIPNPTATPTQTTTYTVRSRVRTGGNLVINGDFENGNAGFNTGYLISGNSPLGGPGHYTINTSVTNNWWPNCTDHTSGSGNMLIADGANGTNGVPAQSNIWCQTIAVTPNNDYAFSAWLTNLNASGSTSQLGFFINGTQSGSTQTTPIGVCQWNEFYEVWNSGTNTTVNICIREMSGAQPGNDYALDDISFYQLCEAIDSVTVRVSDPQSSVVAVQNVRCFGQSDGSITVATVGGIAPIHYSWSNGQAGISATALPAGNYTVTVTDSVNCSQTLDATVTEPPQLQVSLGPPAQFCRGNSATITANATGGTQPHTLQWSNGANGNSWSQTVTPNQTSIYTATVIDDNGCSDTASVNITVYPQPVASFDIQPVSGIVSGDMITIINNSTYAEQTLWNMGDGTSFSSSGNILNYIYGKEGDYCIDLLVSTSFGCTDTEQKCIKVVPGFSVYIPNTLTVNDDNLNETFKIIGSNIEHLSVSIYNRWGEILFRSAGKYPIAANWDGKYRGVLVKQDVYIYKVEIIDTKGTVHYKHGHVTVLH